MQGQDLFLRQNRIQVRPTSPDDLEFVIASERDSENLPFIRQWTLEQHRRAIDDESVLHLTIEAADDGRRVGYIILCGVGSVDRSIEFKRIVITEKGGGLGRDAVRAIETIVFETFGAHRLWLEVMVKNTRAKQLYETEGFVEEGTLREAAQVQDRFESLVVMSMLEAEYEPR
ncbi:MAG: GNAT family N-acetyltransferase [Phycisphaerales bacterium]|nr:MAG: GNAT family N-acetyltransferase [Phycisphaerales bacterium]